ncbi:hypothetical protein [Streptosporangium sp. KLBMP 9127]|nr:hypothetical protein [Streptosporangium sp. KLBMP 9127]
MEIPPRAEVFPKTVRKVILTLFVGGSSFALTNVLVADPDLIWSITLSVFIGGVVFVVQFLVDSDNQLEAVREEQLQHHHSLQLLMDSGFNRINEATELFGLVESSALQTDVITQFVRNATGLGIETPELVQNLAQSEIARVSHFLRELGEGSVIQEGEDREWLLGLSRHATRSIDAVSIPTVDAGAWDLEGGFWTTDLGLRYLQVQRDRVHKGVRIRRIFVLDRSDRPDEEVFRRIYKWQSEIRIEVRVLDPATIPTTLRGWLSDFVVFDEVVSYETTPGPDVGEGMHMIMNTQLVLEQARVRAMTERFNVLWDSARSLT